MFKKFASIQTPLLLLLLFFAAPSFADAPRKFCVVDELLPVARVPGAAYVIEDGYVTEGEEIVGAVVYGNHIAVRKISGEYGDAWVELLDPEDEAATLGYVERKGLEPLPDYRPFEGERFVVRADAPDLLLQPGARDAKYRLSNWGFSLLRGEIATAYGAKTADGVDWLLLGFSATDDAGGGVGMRYAWARSDDLVRQADYEPNYEKNEEARVPAAMRRSAPFYSYADRAYRDGIEALSDDVRARLVARGFDIAREPALVDYVTVDDMADLYAETGGYEADFLTTDMFLHAYHLIFSRMLQHLEEATFAPALAGSLRDALHSLAPLPPEMRGQGGRAYDMLAVPLYMLASGDVALGAPDGASAAARDEAALILSADARGLSPLTGTVTDYTQYRPRGHYAGNPVLEDYFRAMSFLGNAGLPLFANGEPVPENVATAALIVLALEAAGERWRSFDGPIDYLVGTSDDGSFAAYREVVTRHVASMADAKKLGDEKILAALAGDIRKNMANPRIRDRETGAISKEEEEATRTPEFRISGKRFTFDAYAMNRLTSPRVGSDADPRNLPEGTDVMAVLGSPAADEVAARNFDIDRYEENLRRLKGETDLFLFGSADTAYARWLRVLEAVFKDSSSKQVFYRSDPWGFKKLATASASWAELKHNTVLYAKQGGAEMGEGGDWYAAPFAPPLPRGYVEPDPQTFAALASALERLASLFETFAFEEAEGEYVRKIASLREMCEAARDIAERQVRDEMLTDEDYDDIKRIARWFGWDLLMQSGGSYVEDWRNLRMAIVTDVATDFMDGVALHVATGAPRKILVFVDDRSGGPRVARGYVYSYYEFPRPLSEGRMTDAEWRELVYDPERVPELEALHPDWYGRVYGE